MKNWKKKYLPYEGKEPYLYFAFAEDDSAKVRKILCPLMERGCRIWYCCGPAGSSAELLRRQERSAGAALTVVYLTDAACADKDTKSTVLVNQKYARPILCLYPDETDRRLAMGLREDVPHIGLSAFSDKKEITDAVLHAEGFLQDILGEPVKIEENRLFGKLTACFCVLAILLLAVSFIGARYLHWFTPSYRDEVVFTDPVLLSAVRTAAGGGAITAENAEKITYLRLDGLPESWEELALLPALERIELPQQALLGDAELSEGDYMIELSGGDGA